MLSLVVSGSWIILVSAVDETARGGH
jgi:hypothetical protein